MTLQSDVKNKRNHFEIRDIPECSSYVRKSASFCAVATETNLSKSSVHKMNLIGECKRKPLFFKEDKRQNREAMPFLFALTLLFSIRINSSLQVQPPRRRFAARKPPRSIRDRKFAMRYAKFYIRQRANVVDHLTARILHAMFFMRDTYMPSPAGSLDYSVHSPKIIAKYYHGQPIKLNQIWVLNLVLLRISQVVSIFFHHESKKVGKDGKRSGKEGEYRKEESEGIKDLSRFGKTARLDKRQSNLEEEEQRVHGSSRQVVPMVGRLTGNKNKPKEENMQRYMTGKEEPMIKFMKEMEENICKRMENMIEQIEQMRKEWKEGKLEMEERRRKDKEEHNIERKKLERRIKKLEWENEKKDRGRRRNNIDKENKCTIIAELESWEEKKEVMTRKKELSAGIFIDNNLTRKERKMQMQLKEKAKEEKEKGNSERKDLNARIGSEGGLIIEEKNEKRNKSKKSIDIIINKEGRRLIERIEERGWAILNGSFEEEGGWTYIGERGFSLIDHMIGNDGACEEIKRVEEGNRNGVRSHPIRGRAARTANNGEKR
ncbi:hypothetical protein G5I_08597 [Acromyrmex echinatior]|uniref:Uncharacterized protein n=1 Tax=Acromyrmex echinatior TaxID=103372 RepID=F4WRZ1_ACREC|nr:hypothetical protein G5I_08597 [Acromyrmex echinatior]